MTINLDGLMPTELYGHDQDFFGKPKIPMGMPAIFLGVPNLWEGLSPSI